MSVPQQLSAFNNTVLPRSTIKTISSTIGTQYNVTAADYGVILNITGTASYSIFITAPAASFGLGFYFDVLASTTGSIGVNPHGADTINKATSFTISGGTYRFLSDGTSWKVTNFSPFGLASRNVGIGDTAIANAVASVAIGYSTTASATYSTAIGVNSAGGGSVAAGSGSVALGGAYASSADSFAAMTADNSTTYGAKAIRAISLGYNSIASGQSSVALSTLAQATQTYSVGIGYNSQSTAVGSLALFGNASGGASIAIGSNWFQTVPTASANTSVAIGDGCTASAIGAYAFGVSAKADVIGKFSFASNYFAAQGDAQTGKYVLRAASTSATPVILTTDGATASTTNQLIISANSAYTFTIIVVARQQVAGGTASASWKIEGLIRREATATVTLVNYITTVISNVPGWTLAVSADSTNSALAITATGAAATNIRWVATAMTSEVTYA